MFSEAKVTEIYCITDDFCKEFALQQEKYMLKISFVNSTPLRVCRNQRILIHKTYKGLAKKGKCSMGCFLAFKELYRNNKQKSNQLIKK